MSSPDYSKLSLKELLDVCDSLRIDSSLCESKQEVLALLSQNSNNKQQNTADYNANNNSNSVPKSTNILIKKKGIARPTSVNPFEEPNIQDISQIEASLTPSNTNTNNNNAGNNLSSSSAASGALHGESIPTTPKEKSRFRFVISQTIPVHSATEKTFTVRGSNNNYKNNL